MHRARIGRRVFALRVAVAVGAACVLSRGPAAWANTEATWSAAASGSWTDPTKWSTNPSYPSDSTYDAFLSATGSAYTVTLSSSTGIDNISISSANASLDQTAGTLTLAGTFNASAGTYQLSGGTVTGGTLESTGGMVGLGGLSGSAPTISGVTLEGTVTANNYLTVTNGLTLNSATLNINSFDGNSVLFSGAQSISGTGTIVFYGNSNNTLAGADSTSTLTIGSGVTITGATTTFGIGTIGNASAPLVNDGTITCSNSLDNLTFTGANWVNNGTINVSAGTIVLGGTTTTSQLGTINNTGGSLVLAATLTNTGTLDLANTGSLQLDGADIVGGTITSTNPAATLYTNGGPATLNGVTLDVALSHVAPYGSMANITVQNGLTLQNHNITLNSGCGIVASDSSTFGGTGEIIVNNLTNGSGWVSNIGGTNVTIGPSVTITTGSGGSSDDNFVNITTLENKGTIALGTSGTPITVSDTVPWTNSGTISVASNTMTVDGSWTNTGSMTATGGTLALNGTWSNTGSISENNAVLIVGGTGTGLSNITATNGGVLFSGNYTTAQALQISRTKAYIGVTDSGVIDNTGATLNADGTEPIEVMDGTIQGGTITSTNGGKVVASDFATLSSLTLDAPLSGGVVTADSVINNSTMIVSKNGALTLEGSWANNGAIAVTNSTLVLDSVPSSLGMFRVTGGFESLFAPATTAQIQQIISTKASWSLNDGATLNNTGNNLVLSQNGSNWSFYGGEIDGGTISSTDGTQLSISPSGSTFFISMTINGVTLSTGAQVTNDVTATIENGLTLADGATVQLGATGFGPGSMSFSGTQTLGGTGEILLQGDRGENSSMYPSSGTLTIGPNITVAGGSSFGTVGSTAGSIVNNGLISSPVSGITLTIDGAFTNNGTIQASNGGTLTISSPNELTNLDPGTLTGGTWNVFAGSTLNLPSTTITTNAANITLNGTGSNFAALNTLANNLGTLTVSGGRIFTTSAPLLTNDGMLAILSGSQINALAFDNNSDGTMSFQLSKGVAASGLLDASGAVNLGGTLQWSLAPGYTPAPGDSLTILQGLSVSGVFADTMAPALPPGVGYSLVYSPSEVQIDFAAVPEPAIVSLLLVGGAGAMLRRSRRAV
jgi:hypothetical protein